MTGQSKMLVDRRWQSAGFLASLAKRMGIALAAGGLLQIYKSRRRKKSNRDTTDKNTPKSWSDIAKAALEWPTFVLLCNIVTRIFSMGSTDRDGLATAGFAAAVLAHFIAPILSSDIALYALLRSAYSYHKLRDWTVTPYHVFAVIYPLIAWQATYQCKYLQPGQRSLYFDIGKFNMTQITCMYNPESQAEDGSLPKCEDLKHFHPNKTCNESIRSEFMWRIWRFVIVYAKYYGAVLAYSLLTSGKTRAAWISTPLPKLITFLKDMARSSIFLFLIVSMALQYPCWVGKHMGKWHQHVFIVYAAVVGHLALRFEKPQRRAALALFCTWRVAQQMIRTMLDIKTYDTTRGTILDGKRMPGIMFGGAIFMWLLCKDNPRVMKGIDKMVLESLLG